MIQIIDLRYPSAIHLNPTSQLAHMSRASGIRRVGQYVNGSWHRKVPLVQSHFGALSQYSFFNVTRLLIIVSIAVIIIIAYRYLIQNHPSPPKPDSFEMAWFSSGGSNTALINNLARNGLIVSDRVKHAMQGVCPTSLITNLPSTSN